MAHDAHQPVGLLPDELAGASLGCTATPDVCRFYLLAARLEPIPVWPHRLPLLAGRTRRRRVPRVDAPALQPTAVALPLPDLLRVDEETVPLVPAMVQSDSQQLVADPAVGRRSQPPSRQQLPCTAARPNTSTSSAHCCWSES